MEYKEKMVYSDFAEYVSLDKSLISRAVKSGRITKDCLTTGVCSDGKTRKMLWTDKAIKALDVNKKRLKKEPVEIMEKSLIDYQKEKVKWESIIKKLEAQKLEGSLIDKELWDKNFLQIFDNIKDSFMSATEYLSKTLLNINDPDIIRSALNKEYDRIISIVESYRKKDNG